MNVTGEKARNVECPSCRRLEAALEHRTRHDALTGLPNRVLLVELLRDALGGADANGDRVVLVLCDIDHFRVVNDGLGHEVGDALLSVVARRIERVLRPGDHVARFGADEFAVVTRVTGPTGADARAAALEAAARVAAVFERPFTVMAGDVTLTATCGVATSTGEGAGDRPERLVRDADAALTAAKARGRGQVEHFAEAAEVVALGPALARDEFVLHYQPLVRFDTSEVYGFEALLRWNDPARGLQTPDAFLVAAEAAGLMPRIGAHVLAVACAQAARWSEESVYPTPLVISVNVSGSELASGALPAVVQSALGSSGLNASQLLVEIPEHVVDEDVDRATAVVGALRRLGVRCVVDDVGAGTASLRTLARLPVAGLKLDRSLIDGLGTEGEEAATVAAVIALARARGLSVVAEGVETPRQLSELRSLGCDAAQGFYFARPQPAEVVRALVHRRCHWSARDATV